jgi:uncharacterized protein YhjY with autotransporter beta-barrel domain
MRSSFTLMLGLLLLAAPVASAETLSATTAFNEANAQNNEMLQRLWALKVAKDSGAEDAHAGLVTADGKETKNTILRQVSESRWSVFVDGNGIFSQVKNGGSHVYNINGGGVTLAAAYDWSKSISTGFYAGYEGAGLFERGSSTSDPTYKYSDKSTFLDNAFRYGLFGTFKQPEGTGIYGVGLIGGTYHQYNAGYNSTYNSTYTSADPYLPYSSSSTGKANVTSSPGAGELDSMLAGGYDFKAGGFTFGPTSSLQYTYFAANNERETYNSSGSSTFSDPYGSETTPYNNSAKFLTSGYDTSSMLSGLGGHVAYTWTPTRQLLIVPQISLNWQHEFLQNKISLTTQSSDGYSYKSPVGRPLLDTLYTGVGVTVEYAKRWNASFFYNASVGNQDLVSQNIFLSLGSVF